MNYKDFNATDFKIIPKGEKLNARILELDNNKKISAFVFSEREGVYSCLLPVINTSSKLPELNGLLIQYEQFKMPGADLRWYVLIECKSEAYLVNFTEILKEIIGELDKNKFDTIKCVNLVISKWRHFLSVPTLGILSEDKIIGLLGELLFLRKLIDQYQFNAIEYWVAERGEEDFIFDNNVIEVKSTLKEKHEHIINGIDQLLIIPGRNKKILSLLLVKNENQSGFNLVDLINDCAEYFNINPSAMDSFFEKLKTRGYDHRDSNLYLIYNYNLFKGAFFDVENSFPKLTSSELRQPLNSRISKVRYTLDLEGLASTEFVATSMNQFLDMKYRYYLKKLTSNELGYRNGKLSTGQMFYISKQASEFFPPLSAEINNDSVFLEVDVEYRSEPVYLNMVYHNDKYNKEDGTRDEYRIYLNRDIAPDDFFFRPDDIVLFESRGGG
jgi:hypothetical protein